MTEDELNQIVSEAETVYDDTATEDIILEFDTERTVSTQDGGEDTGRYVTVKSGEGIVAAFDELVDRRNELEELENFSVEGLVDDLL